MKFEGLNHKTVYNLLIIENNGVYIAICWFAKRTIMCHAFIYDIQNTTMVDDSEDIYCGTLDDTSKYAPIIFLKKEDKTTINK